MLRFATVVSDRSERDEVGLNDTVRLLFEEEGEEESYRIVTSIRGNSLSNLISNKSPLGKALLKHRVGDRVTVRPGGGKSYTVRIRGLEKTGELETDRIRGY